VRVLRGRIVRRSYAKHSLNRWKIDIKQIRSRVAESVQKICKEAINMKKFLSSVTLFVLVWCVATTIASAAVPTYQLTVTVSEAEQQGETGWEVVKPGKQVEIPIKPIPVERVDGIYGAKVTVSALNANGDVGKTVAASTTDKNGIANITLPNGKYNVSVEYIDWNVVNKNPVIISSKPESIKMYVTAPTTTHPKR
jgi:hypothetical protein